MIVDERDYPALQDIDPPGVCTTTRFSTGWMDWRATFGAREPAKRPIIDLEPRIEVYRGQPKTVWST